MRVYFKNLDGLRFFAALMVILQHTSDYKSFAVPGYSDVFRNYLSELGGYGVTLFFVLSGFLISYLLFAEKEKNGTVDIKNFYLRRILRIWPLYFLYGILIIFTVDFLFSKLGTVVDTPELVNLLYLATFTVNFQMIFTPFNKGIVEILWSVCIEEQFYAIWPWIVKWFFKNMKAVILSFIIIGIASSAIMYHLNAADIIKSSFYPVYFFPLCRFTHFGVGILAAWLLFNKSIQNKVRGIIASKTLQITVFVSAFILSFQIIVLPKILSVYLFDFIPAALFAFIILAASGSHFIFNFDNKVLRVLGTYSYGLYIIHPAVGQLLIAVFKKWVPNGFFAYDVLFPLTVTLCTIILAAISYEFYEKHFLRLKQKFTVIKNKPVENIKLKGKSVLPILPTPVKEMNY